MRHAPDNILDQLLVLQCQAGRTEALATLFGRWQPRLRAHAWRMTGNAELADDVTQESWLGIARNIGRLSDPATFPAWALRITTRRAVDAIGKRTRHRRDDAAQRERASAAELGSESGEAIGAADDETQLLRNAIDQLSGETRALLALHYMHRIGVRHLAQIFNISPGTVKSRLFSAREQLRRALEQPAPPVHEHESEVGNEKARSADS